MRRSRATSQRLAMVLAGAISVLSSPAWAESKEAARYFSGNVSWYGPGFHGKKTASGAVFDMNKLTCAHRTLPFGTKILIENPRNGLSVIVEVTDRGPFHPSRVIDLSREAARRLGTLLGGVAFVDCYVLEDDVEEQDAPKTTTPTKGNAKKRAKTSK